MKKRKNLFYRKEWTYLFDLKKWMYLFISILVLIGIFIFVSVYYPPLPVDSISRSEVIEKASNSNGEIVKISEEDGYNWYVSKVKGSATSENLKGMMEEKGWHFKGKRGESFIFQNNQGETSVSSRMWTKKYIFFYFPETMINEN